MSNRKKCLWFGTLDAMQWVATPNVGSDMSPESWGAGGTLLSGGGYQVTSWGSHKTYTFEWPASSSREVAQLMKSYADGTYGRGLFYLVDPLIYDQNVLPARVADPSMAIGEEGASLVYGVSPTPVVNSGWQTNRLPVRRASYNLGTVASGFRGREDATFVPIPEGYTLSLGAIYYATGSGGVYYSPQNVNGTIGSSVRLEPVAPDATALSNVRISGVAGIWLWVGRAAATPATVTLTAMSAQLAPTPPAGKTLAPISGPWIGGMGNSGVRFQGKPTWINNGPFEGGRVAYAVSFREVGSWVYG